MDPAQERDLQSQVEEIEALSSIYGDEWCVTDEAARIFCIRISEGTVQPKWTVRLQVTLPPDYPSSAPPVYQINAAWLRGRDRLVLSHSLEELYVENAGENILYLWVEKIREFLVEKSQSAETDAAEMSRTVTAEAAHDEDHLHHYTSLKAGDNQSDDFFPSASDDEELPQIQHGETITDRRSTFQPHLAPVVTPKQVKMVLNKLYENKKIASATHNIYAYRTVRMMVKRLPVGDCFIFCSISVSNSDREHALNLPPDMQMYQCVKSQVILTGGCADIVRDAHQILDVRDVLVVVSRWYGGIQLGADRFKHINNCARNILVQEGYTDTPEEAAKAGGKNKRAKSKKAK